MTYLPLSVNKWLYTPPPPPPPPPHIPTTSGLGTPLHTLPSKKTKVLKKSVNMGIWVVCTLNQIFMRGPLYSIRVFEKSKKLKAKLCSL